MADSVQTLADTNARLTTARRLTRRRHRREAGRFLAEGAPAVREALGRPGVVLDLYATPAARDRHGDLLAGHPYTLISDRAAIALSETSTPQGLLAVCERVDVPLGTVFAGGPRLVAVLVAPNDPGNLGTIVRTADAAGADAVVIAGDGVDVYNGKAVRASAGSLFHLDVVIEADVPAVLAAGRAAGSVIFAADGAGTDELRSVALREPTLWLFGNEAHGLAPDVLSAADHTVRVPIYGQAESLNLAAAAAVCLYASATAQRRPA